MAKQPDSQSSGRAPALGGKRRLEDAAGVSFGITMHVLSNLLSNLSSCMHVPADGFHPANGQPTKHCQECSNESPIAQDEWGAGVHTRRRGDAPDYAP